MGLAHDLGAVLGGYQEQLRDLKQTSAEFLKAGLLSKHREAEEMAKQVENMVLRLQSMGHGDGFGGKEPGAQPAGATSTPARGSELDTSSPTVALADPRALQGLDAPIAVALDGSTWGARIHLPGVTSGGQVEVDVVGTGTIELRASGARVSILVPALADSASLAVKFSKTQHVLTLKMKAMSLRELAGRCSRGLSGSAFCTVDNFLDQKTADELLTWAIEQMHTGALDAGELEGGLQPDKRGDHMAWVHPAEAASLASYAAHLDQLILKMGVACEELGSRRLLRDKAMVTCYPGTGARYVRHTDNTNEGTRTRVITCILYLNPQWAAGDGGELRLHLKSGVADLEPRHNRLAIFWSDQRVPHEVLPAHKERYAVSFWYHDELEMGNAS